MIDGMPVRINMAMYRGEPCDSISSLSLSPLLMEPLWEGGKVLLQAPQAASDFLSFPFFFFAWGHSGPSCNLSESETGPRYGWVDHGVTLSKS